MDVLYKCCCGMDVRKDTVAACILIWGSGGARKLKRVFGTTTTCCGLVCRVASATRHGAEICSCARLWGSSIARMGS